MTQQYRAIPGTSISNREVDFARQPDELHERVLDVLGERFPDVTWTFFGYDRNTGMFMLIARPNGS